MKLNRLFASMVILAVSASTSFAAGVASINWNSCTGPVNIATAPGTPVNAYVSILGQTQTSQAYQCVTLGGSAGGPIADAWRFDPAGCQGSSFFTLNHLAPAAVVKTCPSFQGAFQSLQIKDYSFDPSTGKVRITLANAYPNADASNNAQGNPGGTNPAVRYFLANYLFDLSFASNGPTPADLSTCGHLEVPVCFGLLTASWLDLAGNETQYAIASGYLTTNDAANAQHCPGTVPAQTTSWGKVKGQYR